MDRRNGAGTPADEDRLTSLKALREILTHLALTDNRYLRISLISFWFYFDQFRNLSTEIPLQNRYKILSTVKFEGLYFKAVALFGTIAPNDWKIIEKQLTSFRPEILIPILEGLHIDQPADLSIEIVRQIVERYINQAQREA